MVLVLVDSFLHVDLNCVVCLILHSDGRLSILCIVFLKILGENIPVVSTNDWTCTFTTCSMTCSWIMSWNLLNLQKGRWSDETRTFIRSLVRFKARSEPPLLRKRVEQAWRLGWWSLLSCAPARAFACSLVDLRVPGGADGNLPLACEVEGEQRYAALV